MAGAVAMAATAGDEAGSREAVWATTVWEGEGLTATPLGLRVGAADEDDG